jgi:hypothetical protein
MHPVFSGRAPQVRPRPGHVRQGRASDASARRARPQTDPTCEAAPTPANAAASVKLEDEVCAICLEPCSNNGNVPTLTPCSHTFHSSCLARWSQARRLAPNCPVCRTALDGHEAHTPHDGTSRPVVEAEGSNNAIDAGIDRLTHSIDEAIRSLHRASQHSLDTMRQIDSAIDSVNNIESQVRQRVSRDDPIVRGETGAATRRRERLIGTTRDHGRADRVLVTGEIMRYLQRR